MRKVLNFLLICLLLLSTFGGNTITLGYGSVHPSSPIDINSVGGAPKDDIVRVINSTSVVLVTGDLVHLYFLSNGSTRVAIEPADPSATNRRFQIFENNRGLFVIPSDVNLKKYDIDLFNVKLLAEQANITGRYNKIRVILEAIEPERVGEYTVLVDNLAKKIGIYHEVKVIHKELGYVSLTVRVDTKDRLKVKELFEKLPQFRKIWLDRIYHVNAFTTDDFRPMLDVSVPKVGGEWTWTHTQLSGEGIRIAILDTGIDFTHKDFRYINGTSKILEAVSMVTDPEEERWNPIDYYGHGTHVAGIAAGTGLTLLDPEHLSPIAHPLVKRLGNDEASMIAGNGTHLAIVWHSDVSGNWEIWFSIYDGVNWSEPLQLTDNPNRDEWPYIAFLTNNRILVMWHSDRTGSFEIWYKVYSNGVWTEDQQLTIYPSDADYLPAFTELPDGTIAMISTCEFVNIGGCGLNENLNKTDIWLHRLSIDSNGTLSFIESRPITNSAPNQWIIAHSLIYTTNESLWAFWYDISNYNFETHWGGFTKMYYNISDNMGVSWRSYELYSCDGCIQPYAVELPNGTLLVLFSRDDPQHAVPDAAYYLKLVNNTWLGPFWIPTDTWRAWRASAANGPGGVYTAFTTCSGDGYGNDIYIIPPKPVYQGVAPKADLLAVKVLNRFGWGYESWIIDGIKWAVERKVDIISMSLGGPPTDGTDPLSQAVNWASDQGVLVVVAAGNLGGYYGISTPGVAAKALTVGAVDDNDNLTLFSSRGPTLDSRVKPEIVAPGVNVCSSVPEYLFGTPYGCWSGTSMATPHVSGAAAIFKQAARRYGYEISPYNLKNELIIFATDDLGYDVYSQGAGRLNLTKEFYRLLVGHEGVVIYPGVIDFGELVAGKSRSAVLYVEEHMQDSRQYNIEVEIIDILSGEDRNGSIEITPTSFTVQKGEQVGVTITLRQDAAPGLYSGKVKLIDNFGYTYYIILGAYVGLELIIHKIPWEGPGQEERVWKDLVQVAILDPDNVLELKNGLKYSWFDSSGRASFILPPGTYEILSIGWYNYRPVFIAYDNLGLTTSTEITIDERNTNYVRFDPNKTRQVYAEVYHGYESLICPPNINYCYQLDLATIDFYPTTADVYYSYSTIMTSIDRYVYYPLDDVNPSDPQIITTSTWHDLIYAQKEISQPINRIVDYSQLIEKRTEYRTHATPRQSALITKFAYTSIGGVYSSFAWRLNIPYSRTEIVTPDAVYYGFYSKWSDIPGVSTPYWEYFGWISLWGVAPGEYIKEVWGEQSLFPTINYVVFSSFFETYILVGMETFTDSNAYYSNVFHSRYPLDDINIGIYKNGIPVQFDWYCFWYFWGDCYIWIEDQIPPAKYLLRTRAYEGQPLSSETVLEYEFMLNEDGSISEAPKLVDINVKDLDLNNTIGKPVVNIEFTLINETAIQSLTFEYSVDGGGSWIPAPISVVDTSTYKVEFIVYEGERYLSLRINITDSRGLKSSTATINGFLVKGALTLARFPSPFVTDGWADFYSVVGASDTRQIQSHPPAAYPAHTIDVAAAQYLMYALGKAASQGGNIKVFMDWQVVAYSDKPDYIYRPYNSITFGGPGVNLLTGYYHYTKLGPDGKPLLPVYIGKDYVGDFVYSKRTGMKYRMSGEYFKGTAVTDYAMITLYYDEDYDIYVLIIAGLSGFSTWNAAYWLSTMPAQLLSYDYPAIVLKIHDENGDAIPEIFEIVDYAS